MVLHRPFEPAAFTRTLCRMKLGRKLEDTGVFNSRIFIFYSLFFIFTASLSAPASHPKLICAWRAFGLIPSQGLAPNPNFCRIRSTRSDAFFRYSSGG